MSTTELNERQVLDLLHARLSKTTTPFVDLKIWIYENMPGMTAAGWSELRGLIKDTYGLSDAELSKEFASIRNEEVIDDFTPLVEELGITGFIRDGMELTSGLESPNAYGFWAWTTILAASLRRQVYVDMGFFKIWPAMQTVIIGPSQRASKTTITDYIVDLARESGRIHILMDEGTQEGLKKQLTHLSDQEDEACGLIYVPEMSAMFGTKDYNADMVKNLTDLFDNRNSKKRVTITHGEQEIKNMAISALLNSNEKWLRESIPPSAFEGGFWARVLPIWCQGTDKIIPIPELVDPARPQAMVMALRRTAFVKGVATLDKQAMEFYVEKYRQLKEIWPDDERIYPFWNKYPINMLRIAMLLSISRDMGQRDSVTISYRDVFNADRLLDWITIRLPSLYNILGTTEHGDNAVFVQQYIKSKGGRVSERKLGRAMMRRMPGYVLKKILQDMKEYGMITRRRSRSIIGGYDIVLLTEDT